MCSEPEREVVSLAHLFTIVFAALALQRAHAMQAAAASSSPPAMPTSPFVLAASATVKPLLSSLCAAIAPIIRSTPPVFAGLWAPSHASRAPTQCDNSSSPTFLPGRSASPGISPTSAFASGPAEEDDPAWDSNTEVGSEKISPARHA